MPVDKLANVAIVSLSSNKYHEAFSIACSGFADASVLHTAVGVTIEDYSEYVQSSFDAMSRQGLSLATIDTTTGGFIGCLMACDYAIQYQNTKNVPDGLRPVCALLQGLEDCYRTKRAITVGQHRQCDHRHVLCSHPSAMG